MLAMILQFNDLFELSIVVNFKLIKSRSLNINSIILFLSSILIFFNMKHMSIDEILIVALHLSFRTQT